MDTSKLQEKLDNFKPYYKKKVGINPNIKFGLEIECENIYLHRIKKALNLLKSTWEYQFDMSLDNTGIEVSSPICIDEKKTYISLREICIMLRELKGDPSRNSAFQIHYDINIFKNDYKNLEYFYKLWSIYEKEIYRYSYGDSLYPRKNIYNYANMCGNYINQILKSKLYECYIDYDSNNRLVKNINNYSLILINNHRYGLSFRYNDYVGLNIPKTIEIRPTNGTIDAIMIQGYIKFFYQLLTCPTRNNFDKELIDYIYDNTDFSKNTIGNSLNLDINKAIELADLIFDKEYDKLCFLKQYVKDDKLVKKI